MAKDDSIARLVHYSGTVQGVGFRHTAYSIACHYAVAGWVRNLPDGRLELFIEGSTEDVESCLNAIRDYWGAMIAGESFQSHEATGAVGFSIR